MFLSSNFHGLKFRGVVGVLALVGAGHAAMGAATEVDKLLASDGLAGDSFGRAVAIDGDVAIVGAPDAGAGAAYIYHFDGVGWGEEVKLTALDGAVGDEFGTAVDISGDVAIVGAWLDGNTGAAYIFRYNGADWIEEYKLVASDGVAADHFGLAVAVDGDVAVVGADQGDDLVAPVSDCGAAYVYEYSGSWSEAAKLTASAPAQFDQFGCAVDIDGEVIVVGARSGDSTALADTGAAYVFAFDGADWYEQAKLLAGDGTLSDNFGESVAINGDLLVVGAFLEAGQTGSIYLFRRDAGAWAQELKVYGSDSAGLDQFGGAVAVSSDERVIVGAAGDDDLGSASGGAYAFELLDTDGDGLTDYNETVLLAAEYPCLDPYEWDSDGDGWDDGLEVDLFFMYDACDGPGLIDTDGDGIGDGREFYLYGTDPDEADTDGDGLDDGAEVAAAMGTGCPDPLDWDSDDDGLSDFDDPDPCVAGGPVDSDGDGLSDDDEINLYGTDHEVADTDGDGLSDFVEVGMALDNEYLPAEIKAGSSCPRPWGSEGWDSDGDGLSDGAEVGYDGVPGTGTSPCNPDSDDDGIGDAIDPTPLDPGATGDWIEEELRDTRAVIAIFDLDLIEAKNNNAAKGRRNAMSNKVNGAANAVADGDILSAIDKLTSLLAKLDDDPTPPDWMVEGTDEKQDLREQIEFMIELLYYEL